MSLANRSGLHWVEKAAECLEDRLEKTIRSKYDKLFMAKLFCLFGDLYFEIPRKLTPETLLQHQTYFWTILITLILIITNLVTLLLYYCSSDSGFQDDQHFPTNKNNKQGSKNGVGTLGIPKITEPICLDLETNLRLARMSYQRALQYIPLDEFGQSEDYM